MKTNTELGLQARRWARKGAERNPGVMFQAHLGDRIIAALHEDGKTRSKTYPIPVSELSA